MKPGVAARVATARALMQVLDEGGHSNVVVDDLRNGLGEEDAAQLQRVALGAIRHRDVVDAMIESVTGRPLASLDSEVRAVLRGAVTELLVDRGEPHGVVDTAVEATRVLGHPRATGFVNAALRRVLRDDLTLARDTMPEWIRDRITAQFGDEAEAALAALDTPAERGVRVRSGAIPTSVIAVNGLEGAGYVRAGVVEETGRLDFIDPASTAVAIAAHAAPGMRVLDVAAAPGGKTAALWDAMGGTGLLVAADVSPDRLAVARERLRAMGVHPEWVVADGTRPPFAPGTFDVVLLDAPCTGLGTLRRRPEIRHRLQPTDPDRLGALQRRLIEASLQLLAPGGRLVYAVCTLFAEETTAVVDGFDAEPPVDVPGRTRGKGVQLAPHTTGTDGMFISVIR